MPGPAPKPANERRRRNASPSMQKLPAAGRSGPPPAWPLAGRAPKVWLRLWALPQAVMWEKLHMQRIVARYAAILPAAEAGERYAMSEVRQMEDRLGLTPMSMLRLRWEVETTDEQHERRTGRGSASSIDDYRNAV